MEKSDADFIGRIALNIKRDRQRMGITQKDLADRSGIEYSSLSRMENGKSNLSVLSIKKLSDALGISAKELLDFKRHCSVIFGFIAFRLSGSVSDLWVG